MVNVFIPRQQWSDSAFGFLSPKNHQNCQQFLSFSFKRCIKDFKPNIFHGIWGEEYWLTTQMPWSKNIDRFRWLIFRYQLYWQRNLPSQAVILICQIYLNVITLSCDQKWMNNKDIFLFWRNAFVMFCSFEENAILGL